MPAPLLTKDEMLARLMDLLREKGFDGASLSDISESTGLGKSSLYHHFPNGKQEIALQGLAYLEAQLEQAVFEPMRSSDTPARSSIACSMRSTGSTRADTACLLERCARRRQPFSAAARARSRRGSARSRRSASSPACRARRPPARRDLAVDRGALVVRGHGATNARSHDPGSSRERAGAGTAISEERDLSANILRAHHEGMRLMKFG
jgi:AcrR family transcriptional regulator